MLPPKHSWDNNLFLSLAYPGGSPLLSHLQMPGPQARTPSPCITGFLILSFPKPLLLHTQLQSLNSCFPDPPTIISQKEHWLTTSSIPHVHSPFSLLPRPQPKALTPALGEFLPKVLQRWLQNRYQRQTCRLAQDQVTMCELILA